MVEQDFGLAVSKLFIEMMKGEICVTSKVNEGSLFKFNVWLDIVPDSDAPDENGNKELEKQVKPIDCKGMTFLVVEDNEINQIIAGNVLDDFGANVEFANNGQSGVEKFTKDPEKYAIIFMDIQMPIMDGLEATRQIRASNVENAKTIPIISMTAEVYKEEIDKATAARYECPFRKTA